MENGLRLFIMRCRPRDIDSDLLSLRTLPTLPPPRISTIGVYAIRFAGRAHAHSHSSIVPLGTLKNNNGVYVFFLFKKAAGRRMASPAAATAITPDDGDRIIIIATTTRVDMNAVRTPRTMDGNDEGRGGMMES